MLVFIHQVDVTWLYHITTILWDTCELYKEIEHVKYIPGDISHTSVHCALYLLCTKCEVGLCHMAVMACR